MKKTLYQVLGVEAGASAEEIQAAYRRALDALRAQPNGPVDNNALMFLREAYQVLSDSGRRAAYDASLARQQQAILHTPSTTSSSSPWLLWGVLGLAGLGLVLWLSARNSKPATSSSKAAAQDTQVVVLDRGMQAQPSPASPSGPLPTGARMSGGTRSAEEVFRQVAPSVVLVSLTDASGRMVGNGSGVVIGPNTVITNCHVALRGARVMVKGLGDAQPASIETADETFDLCRLSVSGLNAPAVELGSVGALRTGQRVFAIGAPHGLELTISDGIVSSLREVPEGTVIQTTAPISPGSSGGGLFDGAGRLVGITTFQHRFGQNLNFAVPVDWIRDMRQRGAGNRDTLRSFAAGQPSPGPDGSDTRSMVVGRWWCYGPVTGWNGEFQFDEDGILTIVSRGKPAGGRYAVRGKVLVLDASPPVTLAIDSINPQQMVLKGGDGSSTVCQRRS